MKMQILIATVFASAKFEISRGNVRNARAIARSFLKHGRTYMGGGYEAFVYVRNSGSKGCWHKVGIVGNQTSNKPEDGFAFYRKYGW
jgi:hypothetical protein